MQAKGYRLVDQEAQPLHEVHSFFYPFPLEPCLVAFLDQGSFSCTLFWSHPLGCGNDLFFFSALCVIYIVHAACCKGGLALRMRDIRGQGGNPSLIIDALDLGVWVCIQGLYYRCIFMLHWVHDLPGVIASKANASSLFLSANDQTLRIYQNKGLSHDRHCWVPNTLLTCNQTSKPRIKNFLPSNQIKEKSTFSQPRIDNKIKQSQVINHTLEKPNDWWRLHNP